jgi:CubicO group peptidase (beta-lactamase class C family)
MNEMKRMWQTMVLISALLGTVAAHTQPKSAELPATPVGRLAAAWLEAFNSGDREAMRAFNTAHLSKEDLERVPMERRLANFARLSGEIGVLKLIEVMDETPGRIVILVESGTGERLRASVEAADNPGTLKSVLLEPLDEDGGPPEATGPPMTEAALQDSIDALIRRGVQDDVFAGVVRIVDGDRVVYEKAAGLAERRFDVPNAIDTRFNIGSITKLFTHVAIAKLASEGRLQLADRLSKHLTDYPKEVADRITIAQLIDHSSGLGDIFGPEYDAMDRSSLRTLPDFLPLFQNKPLRFEPGTDHYYSNAGYTVLGLVIEKLAGMPYADYVRKIVYEPAGMTDSGPGEADAPVPHLATGYTRRPVGPGSAAPNAAHGARHANAPPGGRAWELRANTSHLPGISGSAGGGYSSARDLHRFVRALRHDRLVPPAYTQWVLMRELPSEPGAAKPSIDVFPQGATIGFAGGAPGLNALLSVRLDRDLTLVVLANADPPIAESMGRKIGVWMRRAGVGPAR